METIFNQILDLTNYVKDKESECDFWRGLLNTLVVPMVIVDEDRKIIFQNLVNCSLFDTKVTNQDVCTACKSYGKMGDCHDCPIDIALSTHVHAEKVMIIEQGCYRQVAHPTWTNRGRLVVVLFLPSTECQF